MGLIMSCCSCCCCGAAVGWSSSSGSVMVVSWELSRAEWSNMADVSSSGECDLICLSCSAGVVVATSPSVSCLDVIVAVFVVGVLTGVAATVAAAILLGCGDEDADIVRAGEGAADMQALLAGGVPAGSWSGLEFSLSSSSSSATSARFEEGDGDAPAMDDGFLYAWSWLLAEALAAFKRDEGDDNSLLLLVKPAGDLFALASKGAKARLLVGEASIAFFGLVLLVVWCCGCFRITASLCLSLPLSASLFLIL